MASRQRIGFGVLLAGYITKGKMIIRELREPTSLSSVEFLRLFEISKVLMIGPDLKGMCCAHEVMTPFGKGNHDREHFSIIDLIIALGRSQSLGEISDRFPYTMLVLRQDCADGEFGCVCLHTEKVIISGDGQDGSSSDKSLD